MAPLVPPTTVSHPPPIQVKKRLCHRGWLRSPCPLGWPASRKTPLPRLCPAPASSQTRRFEDVLICTLSPPIGWSHSVHGGLHFPWAPNFKASMGPGPFSRYPHEWSLEFSQSLMKTSPWPRSGCRLARGPILGRAASAGRPGRGCHRACPKQSARVAGKHFL